MQKDTKLFGKSCNNGPSEYSIAELQTMANKIGLITTRQNYNQLCNGLRTYFVENGIQTEDEFEKHTQIGTNPIGPTIISETSTRILGENIDLDILLNSNPDDFLRKVEYFQNLENYSSKIKKIGENSANGFIRKLQYITPDQTYSIVLKGSQNANSDSLVYEYLVGQCINVYARFYPCFAKTYSVGIFAKPSDYSDFLKIPKDFTFPNPFTPFNISNADYLRLKFKNKNIIL